MVGFFSVSSTQAYFTDKTEVLGNTLSTGTLEFDINAQDWEPGNKLDPEKEITREVNIENTGSLDFKYEMGIDIIDDEDDFCDEFTLRVKLEDDKKYNGDFTEFDSFSSEIESEEEENWEFELSRGSSDLSGVNCDFDIVFDAWQKDLSKNEGFTYSGDFSNKIENCKEEEENENNEEGKNSDENEDKDKDDESTEDDNGDDGGNNNNNSNEVVEDNNDNDDTENNSDEENDYDNNNDIDGGSHNTEDDSESDDDDSNGNNNNGDDGENNNNQEDSGGEANGGESNDNDGDGNNGDEAGDDDNSDEE